MNRSIPLLLASATFALVALTTMEAKAQVIIYPTAAYEAMYTPYFYNGHAHYLYHNNWYYRDHGGWHGYDHEPGMLHDHRGEWGSRGWHGGGGGHRR